MQKDLFPFSSYIPFHFANPKSLLSKFLLFSTVSPRRAGMPSKRLAGRIRPVCLIPEEWKLGWHSMYQRNSFFSRKLSAWRGSICCPAVFFLSTSFSHMPKKLRCMLHIPVLVLKETGEGGWNTRKLLNRKVDIADIWTMYFWPQQPLSMDGLCRLLISYAIGTERLEQT